MRRRHMVVSQQQGSSPLPNTQPADGDWQNVGQDNQRKGEEDDIERPWLPAEEQESELHEYDSKRSRREQQECRRRSWRETVQAAPCALQFASQRKTGADSV